MAWVREVLIAALLLAVDIGVGGNVLKDEPGDRLLLSIVVASLLALAVVVRRLWPVVTLVVVVVVSLVAAFLGLLWDPFIAVALVSYPVVLRRAERFVVPGLVAVVLAAVFSQWWYVIGVALILAAWALGYNVRERRAQAEELERQRRHQIAVDERLRIARELHDVVSHGMGLIAVKAGIANHIADAQPGAAREALKVIEATSKEALAEIRTLLGLLRQDSAPSLRDLTEVVGRAESAGVDVDMTIGDCDHLPEPVVLAAYRIVQEAVTNVVKHAAPTRCVVTVRADAHRVTISVVNDGAVTATAPGGHGLVGMRERVELHNGEFTAGPRPDGGFAVHATLRLGDQR
ncbi:sensor histidine kinase [Kibdelosporangium phytohabitans]|uniref:sensor histidine kinase n=1 Tax=Kibdelosporangium phytohabitans TaxID=860235 RepID=UPI00147003D5|nr:histidine kinase [Kibdelosporangium phytohabitans]MBE1466887.1 signal transduction histidine kinase [Kibdelosporangium phytohabitans]